MKGLLLINLGTPESPKPRDVRRYLDEFLMDPFVIDIPYIYRALLVKGLILNTRPKKSAAAYEKIWTDRGSPLLFYSQDLLAKLKPLIPDSKIKLAMRYGKPSIASALREFEAEGVRELTVIPLYPQYSLAATESSIEKVKIEAAKLSKGFQLNFVKDFFDYAPFIRAFSENISATLKNAPWDHLLFSYHGLPERQVKKTDATGAHCLATNSCCETMVSANRFCYRAQCYATTRAIVSELDLPQERFGVSFQSRLGTTPWIKPYTDFELERLAQSGVKHLVVTCPAFVADCLETLEEIEIRAVEDFRRFGGETLRLVPSLNASDLWVEALGQLAAEAESSTA